MPLKSDEFEWIAIPLVAPRFRTRPSPTVVDGGDRPLDDYFDALGQLCRFCTQAAREPEPGTYLCHPSSGLDAVDRVGTDSGQARPFITREPPRLPQPPLVRAEAHGHGGLLLRVSRLHLEPSLRSTMILACALRPVNSAPDSAPPSPGVACGVRWRRCRRRVFHDGGRAAPDGLPALGPT